MENPNKSLELINQADEETLILMYRYFWDKEDTRALVWSRVDMIAHCIEHKVYDKAEKELTDFIEFFSEPKSELNQKYNEIFEKDIEDIKKKNYIEIDELKKG